MCLVGLDMGTTGVKALAFDIDGNQLAYSYREYQLIHPKLGWSELDPSEVLSCTKTVLIEMASKLTVPVDVISISSQGQAMLPIDKNGNALYNIIVTNDGRTIPQYNWWLENVDQKEAFKHTGLPFASMYTINKIMWHKQNNPEIYEKAWKFCCVQDFIIFMLCGETMMDYSLAGRTMMLNPQTKKWDERILELAGIDKNKLSTLVPSTTVAGMLRPTIAKELGLSIDTAIVVGGHDQACGAIGAGVTRPGMAMNALGTVDALVAVLPKFTLSDILLRNNYPCYPHAYNNQYISMAINPNGGLLLKWYKNTFCGDEKAYAEQHGLDIYDYIIEKATNKISDIYVLPHLEGTGTPISDPESTGAIVGLRLTSNKNDICRAVLDSLAYDMRQNILMMESTGNNINEIRTIGGGAKSQKWLQIRADIFQKKVVTLKVGEAASLGAAILGGIGIGAFKNEQEAVERMVKVNKVFEPNKSLKEQYEEHYLEYLTVYPSLKELSHKICRRNIVKVN